jgi:hypothetical protein
MRTYLKSLTPAWPYLLLSIFLVALFFGTGFNRNWPHWMDQELTLGYNGLLVHSGLNQEYLDHPGFFSIHLISYLIGISNWLGLYHLQNISDLNNSESILGSMRALVITARHAALITTLALVLFIYFLASRITHNRLLSFLISLLVFFSNGIFFHFTLSRTEPIAFLFLLGSLFFYIQFFNSQGKQVLALLVCLLMLFSGALNKAQVLVLAPFYFAWTYYFISSKAKGRLTEANGFHKIASLSSFMALAFFYMLISSGLSLAINVGLILFFYGLTFVCARKAQINAYKATSLFNFFYLLAFETLNLISFKLNQNVTIFTNIEDPISMTRWLAPDPGAEKIAMDTNALYVLEKIGNSLLEPLVELFSKGSSTLVLLVFCIGFMWMKRHQLTKKDFLFSIYCFFSFYLISLINRTRYVDAPHYLLLSEFFILTLALVLISKLGSNRIKIKTVSWLIFVILLVNLVPYTRYYNLLIRKGGQSFCTSTQIFLERIDVKRIAEECKTNPQ